MNRGMLTCSFFPDFFFRDELDRPIRRDFWLIGCTSLARGSTEHQTDFLKFSHPVYMRFGGSSSSFLSCPIQSASLKTGIQAQAQGAASPVKGKWAIQDRAKGSSVRTKKKSFLSAGGSGKTKTKEKDGYEFNTGIRHERTTYQNPILCKNRFQATTLSLLEAKAGAKPIDSPLC